MTSKILDPDASINFSLKKAQIIFWWRHRNDNNKLYDAIKLLK